MGKEIRNVNEGKNGDVKTNGIFGGRSRLEKNSGAVMQHNMLLPCAL